MKQFANILVSLILIIKVRVNTCYVVYGTLLLSFSFISIQHLSFRIEYNVHIFRFDYQNKYNYDMNTYYTLSFDETVKFVITFAWFSDFKMRNN